MLNDQTLLDYLRRNCYGQKRARAIAKISEGINHSEHYASCPKIRQTITRMIEEGQLIGSCTSGYFIISNAEEMEAYVQSLRARAHATMDRADYVMAAWHRAQAAPQQPSLFA